MVLYKPLRGHYPVTFILVSPSEELAAAVLQDIPEAFWDRMRLWHDGSRHWIQLEPPVRLPSDRLQGQGFVANGPHHQAAEILELGSLAGRDPSLFWLEFGQLQSQAISALEPIASHTLLAPLEPAVLPLWELPAVEAVASLQEDCTYTAQETQHILNLENLAPAAAARAFSAACQQDLEAAKARSAPASSLWKRLATTINRQIGLFASNPGSRDAENPTGKTGLKAPRTPANFNSNPTPARKFSFQRLLGLLRSQSQPARGGLGRLESPSGGWVQNLQDRLRQRIMESQLGAILGRRQAEYFSKLMQAFKDDDLSEALKMAVPLADYQAAVDRAKSPALGTPGKRAEIKISKQKSAAGSSFNFAEDSYQQMRDSYERAYQHLAKTDRHKEAAFILAELLNRVSEAIDYLAREGFLEEAAEIAEGRLEKPEKAIALWIRAGNIDRAIVLAVRTNAFRAALLLLAGTEEYRVLESLWLERLYGIGDFETLFQHYSTEPVDRDRLANFLQADLPKAYLQNPTWLARYAVFHSWLEVETELEAIFSKPQEGDFTRFTDAFLATIEGRKYWQEDLQAQVSQPLLKEWYRQILMYRNRPLQIADRQLSSIRSLIGDRLFVDCKPQAFAGDAIALESPETQTCFQLHGGEALIEDVGLTGEGRLCVALGALGVRIYTPTGRLLKHLSVPAHGLASPAAGNTIVAVEHREKLHRVHCIRLHRLSSHFLGQQGITTYSRTYNGLTWPVASPDRVALIDVDAKEWRRVWSVGDLDGPVGALVANEKNLTFSCHGEYTALWQYQLPQLRLKSRKNIGSIVVEGGDLAGTTVERLALGRDGCIYGIHCCLDANRDPQEVRLYRSAELTHFKLLGKLAPSLADVEILYGDANFLILATQVQLHQCIHCYAAANKALKPLFTVETSLGKVGIQVAFPWILLSHGSRVLLYDSVKQHGRLIAIQ